MNLRQQIVTLSESQKVELYHRLVSNDSNLTTDKFVQAFVSLNSATHIDKSQVRTFLEERLPAYMVPRNIVVLDELPKLPNGKVDRTALLQFREPPRRTNQDEAHSPIIETIKSIWESVLNRDQIGLDDNFFELGGDSLLGLRIMTMCRDKGLDVKSGAIFDSPTLRTFAIGATKSSEPRDGEPNPGVADTEGSVRFVSIQPNGSRPPLYVIHALGQGFRYCKALIKHLGSDQPLIGITTMVDGLELRDGDITPYAETLRKRQPHGPYYIAGIFCGGREAFKLACHLRELGEEVAWLGIVQSITDYSVFKKLSIPQRIVAHWNNLRRTGLDYVTDRLNRRRIKREMPTEVLMTHHAFRFDSKPFDGTIRLFRLASVVPFVEPELGWKGRAIGGCEIRDLPGTWSRVFGQPYVATLGKEIRDSMDRAMSKHGDV